MGYADTLTKGDEVKRNPLSKNAFLAIQTCYCSTMFVPCVFDSVNEYLEDADCVMEGFVADCLVLLSVCCVAS